MAAHLWSSTLRLPIHTFCPKLEFPYLTVASSSTSGATVPTATGSEAVKLLKWLN